MVEQVRELDSNTIERLEKLDADAFGVGCLNVWHLVPIIRHGRVYVIREGREIVGSVQFILDWEDPKTVYMVGVSIAKECRGQGLAVKLLKESFDTLRQEHISQVELTVDPHNTAAIRVYETKLGFIRENYRENEYGAGEHRLVMKLRL